MEEETTAQAVADTEAPPGETAPEPAAVATAEAPPAEPIDVSRLPDFNDPAATEAWIAAATAATNAAAEAGETEPQPDPTVTAEAAPAAAAPSSEPETPAPSEPTLDFSKVVAELQQRGFTVEPPAPPPDPYEELTARLAPHVGTAEAYAEAKAAALAPIPPEPSANDPDWVTKTEAREAAIAARDAAAARVLAYDQGRQITDVSREWARQRVMGELGLALEQLPQKYGLDPSRAQRVVSPTAMTDAVDAVAEAVAEKLNAEWQAKWDANERRWEGKVRQASSDRSAESLRRMGSAPQPGGTQGARPAGPGPVWDADPRTGLPSEAWIQKAISGQLANVDLS